MSSSNFSSDGISQNTEVKRVFTPEEKAAMRERLVNDPLPTPEEMKQKLQQFVDGHAEILRICESILELHSTNTKDDGAA